MENNNNGFWKKYCEGKVFICSHCGLPTVKDTCSCPKCKRVMVNSSEKEK